MIEMFKEFEENHAMLDISENFVELPSENYPKFRPKIVKELLEKLDQEGLDKLAAVAIESSKEEKEEKYIVIRKGGCSTFQRVKKTHHLALEWIKLFHHES